LKKAVCKLCRSEGSKLFLKGERCLSEKCPVERKNASNVKTAFSSKRRSKVSAYGKQLREKQKAKHMSGLLEKQFRKYFHQASKQKGQTGETLLRMLECRLDNIIYQLGFASSKKQARQMITHGHIKIDDSIVDRPSYQLKIGDTIALSKKALDFDMVKKIMEKSKQRTGPGFIKYDPDTKIATMLNLPTREDITIPVNEQLIVELYSK